MNTLPQSDFISLFEIIKSLPEDPSSLSTNEITQYFQKLKHSGESAFLSLQSLHREFNNLKNSNADLERTIAELQQNLDRQYGELSEGDLTAYQNTCSELYKPFWSALDDTSKKFFVTAHCLYEKSRAYQMDYSPVIIEFCRVLENEMQKKIFKSFIEERARSGALITYKNKSFEKIKEEIGEQKKYGHYFLSAMDMLTSLSFMDHAYTEPCCEKELRQHIQQAGFDVAKVSDKEHLIEPGKRYVNNYRNQAAHPNIMDQSKADRCIEQTSKLVKRFLSAKI